MIERIIYEADDGTEFDYEEECLQYEWGLKLGDNPQFSLLGHKKQKLDPKNFSSYEDAWFIFIPNATAFHQLQSAWDGNYIDSCRPYFLWDDTPRLGLWSYDEGICRDGWYHVGEYIQKLQYEADEVMAVINGG